MKSNRVGVFGEQVAANFLIQKGLILLDRNWSCGTGELDLVLADGGTLVICEVKTRSSLRYGSPVATIRPEKYRKLQELADKWIASQVTEWSEIRIDLVGVLLPQFSGGSAEVEHLVGVA